MIPPEVIDLTDDINTVDLTLEDEQSIEPRVGFCVETLRGHTHMIFLRRSEKGKYFFTRYNMSKDGELLLAPPNSRSIISFERIDLLPAYRNWTRAQLKEYGRQTFEGIAL